MFHSIRARLILVSCSIRSFIQSARRVAHRLVHPRTHQSTPTTGIASVRSTRRPLTRRERTRASPNIPPKPNPRQHHTTHENVKVARALYVLASHSNLSLRASASVSSAPRRDRAQSSTPIGRVGRAPLIFRRRTTEVGRCCYRRDQRANLEFAIAPRVVPSRPVQRASNAGTLRRSVGRSTHDASSARSFVRSFVPFRSVPFVVARGILASFVPFRSLRFLFLPFVQSLAFHVPTSNSNSNSNDQSRARPVEEKKTARG